MGLDTVELVMAFEERFDITIADADAENLVSVRDVIAYVYARVQHTDAKVCLTQRAFHKLRRSVRDMLAVERNQIRPATPWETLIPLEGRRDTWLRLKASVGLDEWPELYRSAEVLRLIGAASLAIAAATFLLAPSYKPVFAAVAGVTAAIAMANATKRLRVHFAPSTITVGQTAEMLVARMPAQLLADGQTGWTHDQVRAAVRAIVVDRLNVDPTFSDDASFVDDLGAD